VISLIGSLPGWLHISVSCNAIDYVLKFAQHPIPALLSVYDKTNLLDLAKGLHGAGVRLLGSGGTAKKIRDAGIPIEYVRQILVYSDAGFIRYTGMFLISPKHRKC